MQLKSVEYYESLDLEKASKEIKYAGERRGTLEVFGDAINALYFKTKREAVLVSELHSILGKPDVVTNLEDESCVQEYKWQDEYDGTPFSSSTRFLVKGDTVIGLFKDEED